MPLLQIRDCPEDIYQKILFVAEKQHRTLSQQIVVLLERGLGQEQPNIERRRRLLETINRREIAPHAQRIDAVALIREDRTR